MTAHSYGKVEVFSLLLFITCCLFLLVFLGLTMSHFPSAQAHEPITEACPPPPVCPPEGFILVEISSTPAETSMEEALEAIEAAKEAMNK